MVAAGTIAARDLDLLLVTDDVDQALAHVRDRAITPFGLQGGSRLTRGPSSASGAAPRETPRVHDLTCLASLTTVAVLAVPAFGAEKVGGTFRFAKAKVTFTHGCAFRVAVETRPGEQTTTVFLADRPVDCAAAGAGFHPEAVFQVQ